MAEPLFQQAKELEKQVNSNLSLFDALEMPMSEKQLVNTMKHQLVDGRLYAREYEYAQTRAEQLQAAKEGRHVYEQLRHNIVKASEYNLFGSVDVAQISARIEQIISQMD